MPLYRYTHLEVTCLNVKKFPINEMRAAVEYLKQQPQSEYVGLSAVTNYVSKEYRFKLRAAPLINLKDIIGKTPRELWEMFDADVTRQIRYFEGRMSGSSRP